MAGLAAAARLATRDNSVLVCEAAGTVGGTLGSWHYNDLVFDTGACTLTLPATYRDLFIKTGSRKKSAAATLEDRLDLRPQRPRVVAPIRLRQHDLGRGAALPARAEIPLAASRLEVGRSAIIGVIVSIARNSSVDSCTSGVAVSVVTAS